MPRKPRLKIPQPQPGIPSYRRHKASGNAVATVDGRDHYFGQYGSPESVERYESLIARWIAGGRRLPDEQPITGLSVNEVLERWVSESGVPVDDNTRTAVRTTRLLFGTLPATDFGPKRLALVRDSLVATGTMCRSTVNRRVAIIKRAFRWAAAQELVPASVWHALNSLEGLRLGRSAAKDHEPVRPVPDAYVDAILNLVPRPVRGMIELQRYTGCRPGEACQCRAVDIDMSGPVWLWKLENHKTAWRGHKRIIPLGPRAQAVIREYLTPDPTALLFSPRDAEAAMRADRAAKRKTPLHHGNRPGTNRKPCPRRKPGESYTVTAYAHAIRRACQAGRPTGSATRSPQWSAQRTASTRRRPLSAMRS